ncbi:MAG: hypothetical protein DRP84_08090 [Spirochaetes bacterium]|nr:MAG: hypothetical protein DRP84_08090 [Spirochaetota bacterium]
MGNSLTNLVNLDNKKKQELGIEFTADEIYGQVDLWEKNYNIFISKKEEIEKFLHDFLKEYPNSIILTGAGTSEFIGYCVEGQIRSSFKIPINVFSTTKIVTSPEQTIIKDLNTLLISFARSGNSPESIGAVKIANEITSRIRHFGITCNEEGLLYKELSKNSNSFALALNPKTNDRGLAMTASFSNMVLMGILLSKINNFDYINDINALLKSGNNILGIAPNIIKDISSLKFNRAVFLGDSENFGTAIESHLKLQELTSGKVMCGYDTFPGLRHGPEAVIDDNTIVVAYLSLDTYTRKYEKDLLKELKDKQIGKLILLVADKIEEDEKPLCNYYIEFDPDNAIDMKPYYTPPVYIIVGQLLGLFKSLNLGLKPDNPSEDGVINRVVKGVKVYDYNFFKDKKIFNIIAER